MDLIVKSHLLNFNRLPPWKVSFMLCLVNRNVFFRGKQIMGMIWVTARMPQLVSFYVPCSAHRWLSSILKSSVYAACELVESSQGSQFMQ